MNTRLLGAILVIGSLIVMVNNFRTEPLDTLGSAAYVLWGIGGICGVIGLIRLNALGSNAVARAIGFLPLLGFFAFVLGDGLRLIGFIQADEPVYNLMAAIAWLAMLGGMLIVGILTIAAKTWSGWRRFLPLITIVMFPIAFGAGQLVGSTVFGAVLGYSPWVLLGFVIATYQPIQTYPQVVTA